MSRGEYLKNPAASKIMVFAGAAFFFACGLAAAAAQDGGIKGCRTISTPDPANRQVQFFFFVPDLAAKEALKVLVCLPGLNTPGTTFDDPAWLDFADRNRLVLIAPSFQADDKGFAEKRSFQYPEVWSGQALLDMIAAVGQVVRLRTDGLYLFGFSAGAQTAHRFALWKPELCRAVAFFAAGRVDLPERRISVSFLAGCGELDDQRLAGIREFAGRAEKLGMDIVLKTYPDMGHALIPEMEADARIFFVWQLSK